MGPVGQISIDGENLGVAFASEKLSETGENALECQEMCEDNKECHAFQIWNSLCMQRAMPERVVLKSEATVSGLPGQQTRLVHPHTL